MSGLNPNERKYFFFPLKSTQSPRPYKPVQSQPNISFHTHGTERSTGRACVRVMIGSQCKGEGPLCGGAKPRPSGPIPESPLQCSWRASPHAGRPGADPDRASAWPCLGTALSLKKNNNENARLLDAHHALTPEKRSLIVPTEKHVGQGEGLGVGAMGTPSPWSREASSV